MFNSSVVDVGIGLIFVYLILGLMCTTVNEWWAQFTEMRAKNLKAGIQGLLPGLADEFYQHALVKSLSKSGANPSYIPARAFAFALLDLLAKKTPAAAATTPLAAIKSSIASLPASDTKQSLELLLQHSDDDLVVFQKHVETWFDDAMDRVSGWYKKKSQILTALVAAGITIFANADSVQIARKLFLNPTLRDKIVQEAAAQSKQPQGQSQEAQGLTPQEKADLGELTGWSTEFKSFHRLQATQANKPSSQIIAAGNDDSFPGLDFITQQGVFWPWLWTIVPGHLLGWLLTAIAVSLGAPFWFDTLNKFMNIRSAGTAPNEKGTDKSKM